MSQYSQRVPDTDQDGGKYTGYPWVTYMFRLGYLTAGVRFTNVNIPAGATITSAYLKVTSSGWADSNHLMKVYGIDEDNTASLASDPTGRTKTTAAVDWDITTEIDDNTVCTSPDIKTVVQEIVDRGGWSSGNAMGFLILDDGSDDLNYFYDYEDDSTKAPLLEINYISSSFSPSKSPSLSPSVSPSMSPSPGVSFSPSVSPSISLSPSVSPSPSPSISISPSKSPSLSPSISPSVSPEAPLDYGLKIKKPTVNKNVDDITDPKELVFTSAMGVLGLRLLDTVTASTNASGNIDVTDNHSIGYPPITIVTTTAYDGNKVNLPVEWHSVYLNGARETIEVTETFDFKVTGTSIEIIVHAEEYNYDTDTTSNISGRSYTFNIYYYFNELVES
jgi:hypothetical protein